MQSKCQYQVDAGHHKIGRFVPSGLKRDICSMSINFHRAKNEICSASKKPHDITLYAALETNVATNLKNHAMDAREIRKANINSEAFTSLLMAVWRHLVIQ